MKSLTHAIAVLAVISGCAGAARTSNAAQPAGPTATSKPSDTDDSATLLGTRVVDGVSVDVYAAKLPSGDACRTYVTRGRRSQGSPDFIVTLANPGATGGDAAEALAMPIMKAALASKHRGTELTAWTWFETDPGILGRDDMSGVAALPARAPAGIELPFGALTLFPLTRDEVAIVKFHGVPRIATMLARTQREHPAPWWIDRNRTTVATVEQHKREAWILWSTSFQPELTAYLDVAGPPVLLPSSPGAPGGWYLEGTWRLRVTPTSAPVLADHLERLPLRTRDGGFAMAPDELSNDTFVWVHDGGGPQLVLGGEDVRRPAVVLISFYVFNAQTGAQLVDEGITVFLSDDQRKAVVTALRTRTDVTIEPPSKGMMPWRLEWKRH